MSSHARAWRGTAALSVERRVQLRRLLAEIGRDRAASLLRVGVLILERAADPYELLHEESVRRLAHALDVLGPEVEGRSR